MTIRFKPVFFRFIFTLILLFAISNINAAKIYFNDVFKGTGSSYAEQTNSISSIQFISGTGFAFTSTDPADVTFRLTGNNVAGTLSYINSSGVSQSIIGQVSRQDKSGSTTEGLYFYTTTNEAYLLVIPGVTTYSANTNVSTSSDPILSVMNGVLTTQNSQPKITINDVTVNNTDAYAVFTVSLSTAANANISFTPSLTASTATLNTDYTSSMQYYNGSSWVNISTTVSIAQGGTSIQIRVPILNGGGTSNRTFNLVTGTITGGNILNSDGSYGVGTILPSPLLTITGNLNTFSTCTGCEINPKSFTVSGSNLTANIVLTAPSGFQISTTSSSGYSSTVTLGQVSNAVTTTTIFAKLTSNSSAISSGVISVTSTGATSKTITVTTNTDNALSFDGINDFVNIPDNNALDLLTAFTIEAWVNPSSTSGSQVIIGKIQDVNTGLSSDFAYGLRIGSGTLRAEIGNGIGSQYVSSNNLIANKWQHIAMVFNGATVSGVTGALTLYIDGIKQGNTLTTGYSSLKNVSSSLKFGSYGQFFNQFYNGLLDNIKIWNTVKSEAEIRAGMNTELIGNETGLVGYYDFDNGTANGTNTGLTTLSNRSNTASIDGTLTNFALSGTTSNYVVGSIPLITATGSATSLSVEGTLQLSNALTGGTWSSSNLSFARVNSSGLVTGVASGSVSITYTICDKVVGYNLNIIQPTISTTGSLKTFTSCSGCNVTPQSFSVSGTNLSASLVLNAPTGIVISDAISGTYSSSLSLTQSAGTVTITTVFVKLLNNATSASSGVISITSTGAASKTMTVTVNTDNALKFDGTNDYVSLASGIGTAYNNSAVTIEAWIRSSAPLSDIDEIIAWGNTTVSNNVVEFRISQGKLQFILNDGTKFYALTSTNLINTGKWVHVAVVKSGSTVNLYINGQVATTETPGGDVTSNPNLNLANIGVLQYKPSGAFAIQSNSYFPGDIDQVRVWNIAKSSTAILNDMFVEMLGNETGLVANYNFNQGIPNGNNSSVTSLTDNSTNSYDGTFSGFSLSGTTSNFVDGFMPSISAAGNATTVGGGATLSLTNSLSGGTWSSSNASIARVNSTSGLVTGVAAGSVTITYEICGKTTSYVLSVTVPTITTTGTLPVIASCSGCPVNPNSFTVSGSDLTSSIVLTATTGVLMSTSSNGTYSTTISLTPSTGTVTNTSIFIKLINNATTNGSGSINITSTGAVSKTMTVTVNTDNALMFDGINDYVNLGDVLDVTSIANTTEAWVYWKGSSNNYSEIFTKDVVQSFSITSGNKLHINFGNGTIWSAGLNSTTSIPLNKWTHAAATRSSSGVIKIYINGVLDASTITINTIGDNSKVRAIGVKNINGTLEGLFPGAIDNVKFWNIEKTSSEIADNMNLELAGNETNLLAFYNFNQGIINGDNSSISSLNYGGSSAAIGTLTNFSRTGSSSNFVAGFIPSITGTTTANVGASSTLSNTLTGGTWSSTNTAVATVNSTTGAVTGVSAGSSTITYTICEKTVNTLFTVTVPTITTTGTLTAFSTCATTNSTAQTFTVSAQYLTANLVLTAPTGYEIATSSGGAYSSTISIAPSSGSVAASLIYVRTTTSAVNGQSGNIVLTSTDATTKNVATGNAVITQNKTASLTISSNAVDNTICSGSSITFTANATNGGSTPTYQWQLNGSNISGATGSTYTTSALSSNATITAVMTSNIASCLFGSPATSNAINVIVNSVPNNPGAISGLTTICMNSNQVFSIPAVIGATFYTWVVTGSLSASASSTTNVINITAANAAGSGTLTVYANNACGTSINSSTLTVAVNNTPAPTASFTVTANNVCLSSAGITLTNTSIPNATTNATITSFAWDYADGNTYSSTSLASVSHTYTSTGNFDAILTIQDANNCTSSVSSRIVVDPLSVAGTATALNTTICEEASTTLSLTGSTGAIQWQSSSDGINFVNIIGATSSTFITPNLTSTEYYKAIVKSGSCSIATSGVVTVTVSPKPSATLTNITGLSNSATSFDLVYSSVVGNPNEYSISAVSPNAMTGFIAVNNYGLLGSPITVNIPATASGIYNFNLLLNNNILGCTSNVIPFTVAIAIQAPAGLTYTSPNVYTVGTAIGTLTPTSTGGAIASYAVSPSLPAGLTINSTSGLITGTPSAVSTQTSYVVTGTNASGTVTATVVMTVNIAPPAGLTYTSPNVYTVGTAIGTLTPTSSGGAIASYAVSPSLPAGLTINSTSGLITGTPSAVSTQTSYVVTGTNASGTVTATVVMTVNIAPPAGLTYTSPNVYTVGTAIGTLTPTITGGAIASYAVSPSLPAGLTINSTSGLITGTPSAVSTQTSYVVTGTNASGTVTATVVMTVNSNTSPQPQQPQGALNAVDFKLLANDTVTLKLSVSNGNSPFTLILNNSYNALKDTIRNLTPINSDVIFKLKQLDTTKIYTIFKLIDANENVRTSGFTKDTTKVNVLKPKIVLTLKADPTVKQADNSFKTKLLLKIKNAGDLDLRNVQVNANLSTVFPQDINYKLDSVRVLSGNLSINPNYNGAGSATAVSSIQNLLTVSNSESKNAYSLLDQNFLFSNGVSLSKNEEGEVIYYVSIGATTKNVTIKLQFETAGAGILTKTDGTSSSQETKSKSDDGTNINQHPDITNDGLPLPTYVPLIPNEKIGASLSVSASKPVTGGYEFHFIAKIKNFGNINLDSIRIEYDLTKMFPTPDQAELVSNPIIKRGNIVYNTSNYNGNTNIDLFKYGGDLQVGDSALYEYDLKVITNRTSFTWPNYFIVFARSINSGLVINDTSMAGLNPDPNNDNDPIEKFFTSVTINYKAPAPPVVENKTYVFGTNIPTNIGGLVKSTPTGTIPVWCNEKTAACLITPPATPTQIGRYIFALRSYDTTTLLYSEVFVYDTVIIKPPVPVVVNKKYIIGNTNNPLNISSQVTGMTVSVINYYKNSILQTVIPLLGLLPGTTRYTSSQIINSIESDTVGYTVTMLEPVTLLHLQKLADEPKLQSNSTFNITYTFILTNRTNEAMTNVLIADNLQNTFPSPTTFDVVSVASTGGLVYNNAFNGKTDIQLLKTTSSLAASAIDTVRLIVNLQPKGYNGTVNNVAIVTASTPYGPLNINSSTKGYTDETTKLPTPVVIPDLSIDIPEAFSPNRDGVNDRFVILKPFGTTLELEVFNRWGNVVYYNANYNNDWDGRGTNNFIGQDLMDGGYYYTLKTKSANGNRQIFKGFVIIQR